MKIKQKQLFDKSEIARLIDISDLNKKVATLATKAELKVEQDKITKLEAFDSSYFRGKSNFEDDGTQNYLVLILIIFQNGNLKDCPMKVLKLLLYLIIVLLQNQIILVIR